MTLRLRYQTFKNKPKHTGISSDIINKRSMGNWACTILRLYVLFGKERPDCEDMGDSNGACELFCFVDFLSLSRACANGPPHAWVNMEYKLRKCEDMYSSLNEENLNSMSIH